MKTIASLEGKEFLRRCNDIRNRAAILIAKTQILEIRKTLPNLAGNEAPEEAEEKKIKQAMININAILDRLLNEHFEETWELLELLIIPDEPNAALTGNDVIQAIREIAGSPKTLSFLSFWASMVQAAISG